MALPLEQTITWEAEDEETPDYYEVWVGGVLQGEAYETTFDITIAEKGIYIIEIYSVTASVEGGIRSLPARATYRVSANGKRVRLPGPR